MVDSLTGQRVYVSISDPWDFVTQNGSSRVGTVLTDGGITSDTMDIALDDQVEQSGVVTKKISARLRHVGNSLQDLLSGALVPCNFSSEADGAQSLTSSRAIAFIGGLRLHEVARITS